MKYIKNFFEINESQSKKIKKVLTFSVVLDWYNDNKDKIANIIGCKPEELASENELIEQSKGLVNNVINNQFSGNKGNDNINIAGFSNFTPFDKYLLHDILHNIYDVSKKDFNKNLSKIEFSESEVFEEIEVLCIEESFMKYFNIRYPKTDFINQNINQLASFLMMSILKNDPTRIKDILDKKIKPYLEIYGVKYEINEGSPYEDLFLSLKGNYRDIPRIYNSDDFKNYIIHLINTGEGISLTNGDRKQYPGSTKYYYGNKIFSHATERDINELIESVNKRNYIVLSTENLYTISDLNNEGIKLSSNQKYIDTINYDDLSELKLPFKKIFLNSDGFIETKKWFEYLSKLSNKKFFKNYDDYYLVIEKYDLSYSIKNAEEFEEHLEKIWYDWENNTYDYDYDFIDKSKYQKMSFEDVVKDLFDNTNSISIMRRNFRDNDIISNNTKLGSVYSNSWRQEELVIKGGDSYIDFSTDREDKVSISKNILTNNGKKLISVLNSIRGYAIKNYKDIKNKYKKVTITEEDINTYINLDFDLIKDLNKIYGLDYYVSINIFKEKIELRQTVKTKIIFSLINNLKNIIYLLRKLNNKENISYIKSYISKYKNPNSSEEPIIFYQNLLKKLLINYKKLIKLKEFNEEILKGQNINHEEIVNLIDLYNTNKNLYISELYNLIEKYYYKYNILIDLPDQLEIFRGIIGQGPNNITLEIKNPPL